MLAFFRNMFLAQEIARERDHYRELYEKERERADWATAQALNLAANKPTTSTPQEAKDASERSESRFTPEEFAKFLKNQSAKASDRIRQRRREDVEKARLYNIAIPSPGDPLGIAGGTTPAESTEK